MSISFMLYVYYKENEWINNKNNNLPDYVIKYSKNIIQKNDFDLNYKTI